jgi:cellulose/xylan binding protein with CBM9 domain
MTILAMFLFALFQDTPATQPPSPPDPANVIQSYYSPKDWEPAADPNAPEWSGVSGVRAAKDYFGKDVSLPATEIRSRWTHKYLYLLFICPYDQLNVKKDPVTDQKTNKLWNWDVAEAFIGADYLNISRYKEFQVSPQSEYVDLDINHADPNAQKGVDWDSGFTVKGRVDPEKKIWFGEMRIPFQSLEAKQPKAGDELRVGLYRISGAEPRRTYIAWRPTGASTFHVPDAFGSLVLEKEPPEKAPEKVAEKPAEKAPEKAEKNEKPEDKKDEKK